MFKLLAGAKAVPSWVYIAGALGVALYIIKKGGIQGAVTGASAAVVSAAGDVVSGAATGAVLGVGDILGIPRTNETACAKAKRLGNNYEASKYCTASDFLQYQYDGAKSKLENMVLSAKGFF